MKLLSRILFGLALAAPLATSSAVRADDKNAPSNNKQDVTMDQLPKPVKATVQREAKGKNPESMTKSTRNGAVAYEIKYLDGTQEITMAVAANGKILDKQVHSAGTQSDQPKSDTKPDETKPNDTRPNDSQPQKP